MTNKRILTIYLSLREQNDPQILGNIERYRPAYDVVIKTTTVDFLGKFIARGKTTSAFDDLYVYTKNIGG